MENKCVAPYIAGIVLCSDPNKRHHLRQETRLIARMEAMSVEREAKWCLGRVSIMVTVSMSQPNNCLLVSKMASPFCSLFSDTMAWRLVVVGHEILHLMRVAIYSLMGGGMEAVQWR
jgi:hypothetical protein